MKETGATAGSAITLDAWTGEVLAVSNYPVFNPNSRDALDFSGARNRALTDAYEPGSTIKTLTLVAALRAASFISTASLTRRPDGSGWAPRCSTIRGIMARYQYQR